jgi:hypothetical protein
MLQTLAEYTAYHTFTCNLLYKIFTSYNYAGHMGESRIAYNISVRKPEAKNPLGRREKYSKMDHK